MKILQILVFVFLLCGFSSIIKAQADCLFNFRLNVSNDKGIILRGAQVKFRGSDLSYNIEHQAYYFSTLTGCNSKIKGLLEVAVRGFDDFKGEFELKGSFSGYVLKLNAKGSKQAAILEELAVVSGMVKDANQAVIPETRVTLTDESGKRIETITNENGYFRLDVQSGKYSLEFIGTAGFQAKKYENFELSKGYKNLDVVLEVRFCDDCHWIEGTPVKENNKP